jgi:hypothetical protein
MTIANGIIDSFGALKAAITTYLVHQRWLSQYANATIMFEATANHRLRVLPMETSIPLTTTSGDVALPSDYLLWRTILAPSSTMPDAELEYVHPAYLPPSSTRGTVGSPQVFSIEGDTLHIRPINDANPYEFHYYRKIPTITGNDNDTNWLLDEYPNVYLFGVMVELGALQRNADLAQLYKARRDELFAEIIQLHALTTGATSPQVREVEFF